MAELVVHFNTRPDESGRNLSAIPLTPVRAVLIGKAARSLLLKNIPALEHLPRTIPAATEVRLMEDGPEGPVETELRLAEGEQGPEDVCYWVGSRLICWDED